jgi:hypothetical protein
VVALDGACETLTLGNACYIHHLARLEDFRTDGSTSLVLGSHVGRNREFAHDLGSFDTRLGEMSGLRFVHAIVAARSEGELHRCVAVIVFGLDLGDAIVRHIQHSHRNGCTVLGKNAGHADLATDESDIHYLHSFANPIAGGCKAPISIDRRSLNPA